MGRRPLTELLDAPAQRVELLVGVATKAIAMGRIREAETLLTPPAEELHLLAQHASSPDELAIVERMRSALAPVLRELQSATGRPRLRYLELGAQRAWSGPPRRGSA